MIAGIVAEPRDIARFRNISILAVQHAAECGQPRK